MAWIWSHLALFTLVFLFFLCSWLKDPGFSKFANNNCLLELVKNFSPAKICPDCGILKTKRSRHCDSCHRCIEIFDHHCPLINNCVGVK